MPKNEIVFKYTMMESADRETAEIMVYGAITDWKWRDNDPEVTAKEFDKMLKDAKANGAKKLKLRINSGGGMVYQAIAMRTMMMTAGFDAIDVNIEGLCASAATLLTCIPGAHVTIAEGSEYMIHNPSTIAIGNANDFEKTADRLHKMEADFHAMYAARTGKSEEDIKSMMDEETWLTANEAVEEGFCDELMASEQIAAYAADDIAMMRMMYRHMPEDIAVKSDIENEDRTAATEPSAGDASVINNSVKEDSTEMDIKDLTMEELQAGNPALYDSVMQAGAAAERERISEIDAMTPAGYEGMAEEAKNNGTTTMDYCKQIVKAQREKGKAFIDQRREETAPSANVTGEAAEDSVDSEEEEDAAAKEIANFAKQMRANGDTMY